MVFLWNSWNALTKMGRKKATFCTSGRAVLIATSSNLLDTKYKFYGFNDNQETPLTNEYHCHKAGFCKNKYRFHCYV